MFGINIQNDLYILNSCIQRFNWFYPIRIGQFRKEAGYDKVEKGEHFSNVLKKAATDLFQANSTKTPTKKSYLLKLYKFSNTKALQKRQGEANKKQTIAR